MKLTLLATTALAVVLVLGLGRASAAPTDSSSTATGRRLLHSSTTSHTKPMDSWLRWLLIRSRLGQDKDKTKNGAAILQLARAAELNNSPKQKINLQQVNSDEETVVSGDEDFADEDLQLLMPEGRQASKRQPDDYGHMRYGKRDFDDYGHMRFGRR